ncbi:ABC transporter permease [Horticoccus luteus]|uniref:ABC transporter permease n=1 Tax=Horticoccus luteus TaxID=2862869 RepID=A0A8F9XLF9_9BACT|nr:ABC transporter permease [Horticoccus luteus]QYM80663.1 ABC transporter permease [Horticoccus luteus]
MLAALRFALRQLAKSPGFAIVAVLTLGVGIGAVTVAFSAVNAVLLKPFPYIRHQERMLYFNELDHSRGLSDIGICYADFLDLQHRMTTLDGLWVRTDRTVILSGADEPERLLGTGVSWDAFKHMGVAPFIGRDFLPSDAQPDSPEVALLSYGLWQRRFGGDRDIINTTVTLNGKPAQIIGVMPRGWAYPDNSALWSVYRPEPAQLTDRANFFLDGHAMMKPGVTLAQVQAEADTVMGAIAREHPVTNGNVGVSFRDVREQATADTRPQLLLFLGAVSFVFLIACLNVANLVLARLVTRTKEIAIRLALGATRRQLIGQFCVEGLVLAFLGGSAGLLLALWGADAMWLGVKTDIPFWLQRGFDLRVYAVVVALGLIAALFFGILPLWQAARPDLTRELKESGRGAGDGGPAGHRLRQSLVIVEVALALVLLVGAGLMMRSFGKLRDIALGFDARQVLTFRVGLPPTMAPDDTASLNLFRALLPRLQTVPGVQSASAATVVPLTHDNSINALVIEGEAEPRTLSEAALGQQRAVMHDFFQTMRIPLLLGRRFQAGVDRPDSPPTAIVDEAFALQHYGSLTKALGRRFRTFTPAADQKAPWRTIVGVVGNTRLRLAGPDPQPTFYVPFEQQPSNFMTVVLRTAANPASLLPAVRSAVSAVNKDMPIYNAYSMEALFQRDAWAQAFFGGLFTTAGIIALFLASIGVYGVMSYAVAQRTAEIGVRMALGAQPGRVVRLMLGRGVRLVAAGLLIGFVGSWFAAQLLTGFLYGVSPHDPPTFAAVPVLLAAIALFACYVPARRATRIDPLTALRAE